MCVYVCVCVRCLESALMPGDRMNVHNVLSSTTLLRSYRLKPMARLWSQSIPYLVFLFACCFLLFPGLFSFPRVLSSHDVPEVGQLQSVILASGNVSGLIGSGIHLFIFLVIQGIYRALLLHIQVNQIFPFQHFSPSSFHIHIY